MIYFLFSRLSSKIILKYNRSSFPCCFIVNVGLTLNEVHRCRVSGKKCRGEHLDLKRGGNKIEKNYIAESLTICSLQLVCLRWLYEEGWVVLSNGGKEMNIEFLLNILKERDHLIKLGVNGDCIIGMDPRNSVCGDVNLNDMVHGKVQWRASVNPVIYPRITRTPNTWMIVKCTRKTLVLVCLLVGQTAG